MGPEDSGGTGTLSVDCDALRAFAASASEQSAAVDAIESAARLRAAAGRIPGTSVGSAMSRAAGPVASAHTALARELGSEAATAARNADDYARAEDSIVGSLDASGRGTR